ncbi:MAG: RHS repeat-associated core domain-containing protein, partial [Ktedonobacteraceae bacterium]
APFGQRRTAGWAQAMGITQALTINTTETDKGYTGQESLDSVGLVDYNARLYDPALGRFLSVDPMIAHPGSTQSINPYSYVENNPLNKTDPTGEMSAQEAGACNSAGSHLCNGGGNTSVKNSSVTINSKTGNVTVHHADGANTTVHVGKAAAGAAAAGAVARFGTSVLHGQAITGQDPQKTTDHTQISNKATYADKVTYGEVRNYAYTKDGSAPKGLADAKASLGAACAANGGADACIVKDGSNSTGLDKIAWKNIRAAKGGKDLSGGGNGVCVGQTGCKFRHAAYTYKNGKKVLVERKKPLPWTGHATISGARNGSTTIYFYKFKYKGWLTKDDYLYGPKGHP